MLKDFIEKLSSMKQTSEIIQLREQALHIQALFDDLICLEPTLSPENTNIDAVKKYLDKITLIYEEVDKIMRSS